MDGNEIIPHLFRTEYSKLVAVLSKLFGFEQIETAEDIASETFQLAMETWTYKGIPGNPTAWIYTVAKNKARNQLTRNKLFRENISQNLKQEESGVDIFEIDLSVENIKDSQLQMLFTICHPSISEEAQICLALRILCGFGISEIADAFLSNKETIHKRLQRAKETLRSGGIEIALPGNEEIIKRLETVLRTIYLIFSEGYYSETNPRIIRKELCIEAINLAYLLLQHQSTNVHATHALMALMCFHASRLEARQSQYGGMVLYEDQDETLWDTELIEKGFHYLRQASKWEITSKYYFEASIAYWHTIKNDTKEKWINILKLYDVLSAVDPSPVVALNRIYALSRVEGNLSAIREAEKLSLNSNHFYFILLAELNKETNINLARNYLKKACEICKTTTEKEMINKKIELLERDSVE